MNPSTALARVLVDELVANGVRDVVLSPGSRNAPLSMALHRADVGGAAAPARADRRAHRRVPRARSQPRRRPPGRRRHDLGHGRRQPAPRRPRGPSRWRRAPGRSPRTAPRGCRTSARTRPSTSARFSGRRCGCSMSSKRRPVSRGTPRGDPWCAGRSRLRPDRAPHRPVPSNSTCRSPTRCCRTPPTCTRTSCPETLAGRGGPWTRIVVDADTASVPPPGDGERVLFLADLTHPWAAGIAAAGHLVISEAGGAAGGSVLASGVHLIGCRDFLNGARPHRVIVLGRPTLFRAVTALLADAPHRRRPRRAGGPDSPTRAATPGPSRRRYPTSAVCRTRLWAARWRNADAAAGVAVRKVLQDLDIGHSPAPGSGSRRGAPCRRDAGARLVTGAAGRRHGVCCARRVAHPGESRRRRHRRHGFDGGRRRAVRRASGRTSRRADGRPDVSARPHRPGDRPARTSSGPGHRGEQQRRRGHLRHARARPSRVRRRLRAGLRDAARRDPRRHGRGRRCRARPRVDVGRARRRTRRPGRHPGRRGANHSGRSRRDPAGAQRRGGAPR